LNHLQVRLDYSRDRLLLKIAETLQHVTLDCSPAGAMQLHQELKGPTMLFERDLDTLFPDAEETQS